MSVLATEIHREILVALDDEASRYKSFWDFCREDMFGENGILSDKELSACHRELCEWLQNPKADVNQRRRLVLWPRGSLKTTIASTAYPVWRIINNPDIRIIITCETEKLAGKIIDSIRSVIEDSRFKERYGDLVGRKWRGKELVVSTRRNKTLKDPTVAVASVETSEIGGRADLVICDDLHSEKNVTSREMIDKVINHYRLLGPILEPWGEMDTVMTRWDERDLAGFIMQHVPKENVLFRVADDEQGNILMFPEKYTKHFLAEQRVLLGSYLYNLQYRNTPTSPEDQVFKGEWLKRCLWNESGWPEMMGYYLAVDPAISEEKGSDFTAIVVAGVDKEDNWHIVEAVNQRIAPTEIINQIFALAKRWKPYKVGIEVVAYQKTLKNWVEREMSHRREYFMVEELKPGARSKIMRIKALMPRVEYGALRWRPTLDLLTDQFRRFRVDREQSHDDLIDATAYLADLIPPALGKARTSGGHSDYRRSITLWPAEQRPKGNWYQQDFCKYRRVGA